MNQTSFVIFKLDSPVLIFQKFLIKSFFGKTLIQEQSIVCYSTLILVHFLLLGLLHCPSVAVVYFLSLGPLGCQLVNIHQLV